MEDELEQRKHFIYFLFVTEMAVLARRDHHFRGDFTRLIYTIPLRVRANPLAFLSVYFLFFISEIRCMFEETNGASMRLYPEMVLEMQRQHIEAPPETVNHHLVLNSVNITPEEIEVSEIGKTCTTKRPIKR